VHIFHQDCHFDHMSAAGDTGSAVLGPVSIYLSSFDDDGGNGNGNGNILATTIVVLLVPHTHPPFSSMILFELLQ